MSAAFEILPMERAHADDVVEMMRSFYSSPAVSTNGSEQIFRADVDACVGDDPFLEGFVFCCDGELVGYGMLAKSFSTEFGKRCVWIEDIYLLPEFRSRGFGSRFLSFVEDRYPCALLRLEAEADNIPAVKAYRRSGFEELPYLEMIKNK